MVPVYRQTCRYPQILAAYNDAAHLMMTMTWRDYRDPRLMRRLVSDDCAATHTECASSRDFRLRWAKQTALLRGIMVRRCVVRPLR